MSIATTSLKYGWKVLAILTIGAGSIFVADNVLNRITTKDRIEITLAVVERCMATQTGTNPATYGVDPLSIVRTWTDTNGASVTMTNALEWRDDLSMKVELDAKLKALCPYYVDPDSVYDGTTNIVMHTFTGLLASLNLGDGTNFTAIPAIGTNAATYGPWAWRNYVVAWQERYKVLEALQITRCGKRWAYPFNNFGPLLFHAQPTIGYFGHANRFTASNAMGEAQSLYEGGVQLNPATVVAYTCLTKGDSTYYSFLNRNYRSFIVSDFCTNLSADVSFFIYAIDPPLLYGGSGVDSPVFYDNGDFAVRNQYALYVGARTETNSSITWTIGNTNLIANVPAWADIPVSVNDANSKGYQTTDYIVTFDWQFNYCKTKYW